MEFVIFSDDRMQVVRVGGSVRALKGVLPKPKRTLSLAEMDTAIGRGAGR